MTPNIRNKDKILIQLWVKADKHAQIKKAAESVQEPITGWCRRAIFAALRKWEVPNPTKAVYDKCTICGRRHNRDEHFQTPV